MGTGVVAFWRTFLQSIICYPSTDVGVGRLDDSGVGTPWLHELDNMDPWTSGNPWYPLECIFVFVVRWCGGCFVQIIGRCSKSVVILFAAIFLGVSVDVGCLHMSVGLKIESPLAE